MSAPHPGQGRGAPRRPLRRRGVGLLAASLALLAVMVMVVVGPASAAGSPTAAPGVRVELEQVGPTALVPGSQLQVRVRLENQTPSTLSGLRARLFVDSPALRDRAAVAAWAAGEGAQGGDRFSGVDGAEQQLDASLAPGESVDVELSVDADQLRLGGGFGARGVTVDVLDGDLRRLDALRTFVVWMPQGPPPATSGLTLLTPVTAGALDVGTAQLPQATVDAETGPGSRLSRLLAATALPGATLVVDPAVLGPYAQPAAAPSTTPTATPAPGATSSATDSGGPTPAVTGGAPDLVAGQGSDTPVVAQAWLAQLAARTPAGLIVLPQGDPDVQGVVAAGSAELLRLALAQATSAAAESTGAAPLAALVWPPDATAAPGPLVVASREAAGTAPVLVLDAAAVEGAVAAGGLGTAPATASLTATAGDGTTVTARAVLVDGAESALLADATSLPSGSQDSGRDAASAAEVGARLLADSAVAAAAGPLGDDLVLGLPRDWDPDPAALSAALAPVSAAPWVRSEPLADLLAADPEVAGLPVDASAAEDPSASALPADGLRAAQEAVTTARDAARLVADADRAALLGPVERSAVAAASLGWRTRQEQWREELGTLTGATALLRDGVNIVPGSPFYVLASSVSLPVTVRNTLSQAVTVTVSLRSNSYRLRPGAPQQVVIPPGSQEAVQLPVRAVASGDTSVTVLLTDAAGAPVGGPSSLGVRVRAEWEGRGVAAAAAVAALVLVAGVVRTVVRVRRRPATPVLRSAAQADGDAPPRSPVADGSEGPPGG